MFSPWMPMTHASTHTYPVGAVVDRHNIGRRSGCDNLLQTYTVQADGRIGACCGLGMRTIPELNVSHVRQPDSLARAITEAEEVLLKLWIHYEGPERIVAWAARHNPRIEWEGRYAHHCQFCHRLYHDPEIRKVIIEHWEEVVAEVLRSAWVDEVHVPRSVAEALSVGQAP
ncbi:hypothetical protein ABT065_47440 [Streptomyces sp. NPDC002764]|uniref:hypothetical protein n=1 Tax=Streptomyces sp. NPDC002764 TaxID=3154428 RepID=UPI00331E42CB